MSAGALGPGEAPGTVPPMKKLLLILALVGLAAFAAKKVTASA